MREWVSSNGEEQMTEKEMWPREYITVGVEKPNSIRTNSRQIWAQKKLPYMDGAPLYNNA